MLRPIALALAVAALAWAWVGGREFAVDVLAPAPVSTQGEGTEPTSRAPGVHLEAAPTLERVAKPATRAEATAPDLSSQRDAAGSALVSLRTRDRALVRAGRVRLVRGGFVAAVGATDASGTVRFEPLEPGRYEVRVGELEPRRIAPDALPSVRVRPGEEARVEVLCLRAGSLHVLVHDRLRVPVSEQLVSLSAHEPIRTDANGWAHFPEVAPGERLVAVTLADDHPLRTVAILAPQPVVIEEAGEHELALEVGPTNLSLTLEVVDLAGAPITALAAYLTPEARRSAPLAVALSDERGFIRFDDCPRAELRVTLALEPNPAKEDRFPHAIRALQRRAWSRPRDLVVDLRGATGPPPHERIVVDLDRSAASFDVEVEEAKGSPSLSVRLVDRDRAGLSYRFTEAPIPSDPDGRYRFSLDRRVDRVALATWPNSSEAVELDVTPGHHHVLRLVGGTLVPR